MFFCCIFTKMKIVLLLVFAVFSADGAYEGDLCDANGAAGVCKKFQNCPSAQDDIKNRRPRPNTCGFDGDEIIVCCKSQPDNIKPLTTTKRPTTTTTEYVPPEYSYVDAEEGCQPIPSFLTTQPTGQKAWDKCIEYQEKYVYPCGITTLTGKIERMNRCPHNADELIIRGPDAALLEFPHMVLLGYGDVGSKIDWECSGALISEKFVLTAGHCISNKLRNNVSHALVGILKRSDQSNSNTYGIKRIIKHEQYNPPHKYNDIALLELDRVVPLSHTNVPACLHTGAADNVDESRAFTSGWGAVYNSQSPYTLQHPDILQKVVLTKFTDDECSTKYEPHRHMLDGVNNVTQVCYGDRTMSKDTCQGHSGGPLQVKNKRINCMYTIVGVTSFRQPCGLVNVPGIYTRVAPYLPWIERIVWP